MSLTFWLLAVGAGALTVLSPCILPILPALLGVSSADGLRHRPFWIVLGLTVSFTVFGAAFAVFGTFLGAGNALLRNIALAVLFFFGISLLWPAPWQRIGNRLGALAQRIPGADRDPAGKGRPGALLLGGSLGLVWAPCAGPILGIILTLAAVQGNFGRSLVLMGGYSLGAAIPMLAIGYGGRRLYGKVASFGRWGELSHKVLGAVTILTVVALFFNLDTLFLSKLPNRFFLADRLERTLSQANPLPSAPAAPRAVPVSVHDSSLPVLGTMPDFSGIAAWINSPPLSSADLRGKVVLVDFWTYSCINCIRTLPYVTGWYEKYGKDGFVVVGVHTPEFAFEKDEANVKRAVDRFGIRYPVALDNRYETWNAYHNSAWPADYLFDARGRLREVHFGEGHYKETEMAIQELLKEAKLLTVPMPVEPLKSNVDFDLIDSPETYIGYARSEDFVSPETVARDRTRTYTAPTHLELNEWALRGEWEITRQYASLRAPGGEIRFRFKAPKLNLVMRAAGKPLKARVLLDGRPIPAEFRGADVADDGTVSVGFSRLYNLVRLPPGEAREHTFGLIFPEKGADLYSFTFG